MTSRWMLKSTALDFKLPPTVKSIQRGWLYSLQIGVLTSGLFAIIAAILLILKENFNATTSQNISDGKQMALVVMGYVSLFLNISACMSCFILIDRLGELPYHAAQDRQLPKGGTITLQQQGILKLFRIGALWTWVVWHWLICFLIGAWSIFAQLLLYIWIHESKEVRIVLTSLACFCFLPFLAFILAPVINLFANLSSATSDGPRSPSSASPDIESMTSHSQIRSATPTIIAPPLTPVRLAANFRFPSSAPRPLSISMKQNRS
ncbi:hypothetical protein CPB84DRAFT_1517276 [Gymnopilus junonius]|uniref:Uncharacterized protein n=1 Tax=Gymnopilus junonius TaxID=109634 RepID=A0A9P5NWU2_GYMJU|nr:hypothetical protein CPB84DRAFT_1517276 [Gymnopilus junonius]